MVRAHLEPDQRVHVRSSRQLAREHRAALGTLGLHDLDTEPEGLGTAGEVGEGVVARDDDEFVVMTGDPVQIDRTEKCAVSTVRRVGTRNPPHVRAGDAVAVPLYDTTAGTHHNVVVRSDPGAWPLRMSQKAATSSHVAFAPRVGFSMSIRK